MSTLDKLEKNLFYGIIRSMSLIIIAVMVSGCTNSEELEQKNTRLQTKLSQSNIHNVQLTSKIKKLKQKNKSLEKEISVLRNKIKILGSSLTKKYSTVLESEKKKLRNELEQDKQRVKKEAYKVAKINIKDKYFPILIALSILILILILIILFLCLPKNKKIRSEEAVGQPRFKIDGKRIKFYNSTGALKKNISIDENIVSGVQKGDEIHISTATGKIIIYSLRGIIKKTIDTDGNTKYPDTTD